MTESWYIYRGTGVPHDGINRLPSPPPWRDFDASRPSESIAPREYHGDISRRDVRRGLTYQVSTPEIETVNAALILRRPLLVTGPAGTGKSSLAYAVAYELQLGSVLRWSITSRSNLQDGLYRYDALARLQDTNL